MMPTQRTIISGPNSNGSTTYRFNNERNNVAVKRSRLSYKILLEGNNDTCTGGPGNDTIDGGEGNDQITGGQGNDILQAGNTPNTLEPNQNTLIGDQQLIKVGKIGGKDLLSGGTQNWDTLVGDSINLYGIGGDDQIEAHGSRTEMIGDARELQASAQGGEDILIGTTQPGTITTMYGDGIIFYGPAKGGNDQLISGQSDDTMYGDFQFSLPAPFINDPLIFDIYDEYGFFLPPTQGLQPFVYQPVIYDLTNEAANPNEGQIVTFEVPELNEQGEWTGQTIEEIYTIPNRTESNTTPQGGADQFIFRTLNEGNDKILDFNPEEGDRIIMNNGLSYSELSVTSNGRDTLISYGNQSSILLPYFTGLSSNDFAFNIELL